MNGRAMVMLGVLVVTAVAVTLTSLRDEPLAWDSGAQAPDVVVVVEEPADPARAGADADVGGPASAASRRRVGGPDAATIGAVAGRLGLTALADHAAAIVDGEHQVEVDLADGSFAVSGLLPGPHRLTAVAVSGVAVDVWSREFLISSDEVVDLGRLARVGAAAGILSVWPDHARSGAPFGEAELTQSGLQQRRADVTVDGALFFVPIGADVPVRGLPAAGLPICVRGAPPTVRLDGATLRLRRQYEPALLAPQQRIRLPLEFVQQAALVVRATWSDGVEADAHMRVLDLQWGDETATRCPGTGAAVSRMIADVGPQLVVVSAVDEAGAVVGFRGVVVDLPPGGTQVELRLARVWPARGELGVGFAGRPLALGLAAAPGQPLWRTTADASGGFELPWLPADQALVLSVGDEPERAVALDLRQDQVVVAVE